MNPKLTTVVAVAVALASTTQARAQEKKSYFEEPLLAPAKALEIVVGSGYTQGFGSMQQGVNIGNVITPGFAVDLGIGYRIDPHWAVGIVGQYQEFNAERASTARGFTPGIAATYHVSPYTRTDPWIQLGTGYRLLWENQQEPSPNLLTHGFELAKLTIGVDIRVDKDVAIAPVVGADLTLPLWQSVNGATSQSMTNPTVSTFVFAGLQARFDVTTRHELLSHPAPATETQVTSTVVTPPPPQKQPQDLRPVSPSINVSEEIIDLCNLDLDVDNAPKFEFDKSDLLPADYTILRRIAECFTSGLLSGSGLSLVGRADPRGTVQYNDALGMRRAKSVASYLGQLGITEEQMQRTSRGERDAVGTDETTWAIDRRVDISLTH